MKPTPEVQFKRNALCWLAEAGFPPMEILAGLPARSDHCYISCDASTIKHADATMDKWTFATRWRDHQPLGYATARAGWRERRARWAAQIIYHCDPVSKREFLEIDFDGSNPNWGLALVIGHVLFDWCWQKIRKGSTDPFTVAKKRNWTILNV